MTAPPSPRELERLARNVAPGGWAIDDARPIATLLGSCVAVCLWDPQLHLGGLNHFMLPVYERSANHEMDVLLCGNYAMEALLNGMLSQGARKPRLRAKAFGGGEIVASLKGTAIGERNVAFAREWLAREKIPLVAADFLGSCSRKLVFDPQTGDAFCRRGPASAQILAVEARYGRTLLRPPKTDIELF